MIECIFQKIRFRLHSKQTLKCVCRYVITTLNINNENFDIFLINQFLRLETLKNLINVDLLSKLLINIYVSTILSSEELDFFIHCYFKIIKDLRPSRYVYTHL